jgi:hypothetical protein
MIMPFSTALVAALLLASMADAFMGPSPKVVLRGPQHQKQTTKHPTTGASLAPSTTRIFLEDWVAEMIDAEIWRQGHRKDFESAWMEKNRAAIVQNLNPGSGAVPSESMLTMDDPKEFVQHARDVRMAKEDPQRYCADRCITTGNCDVYEDLCVLPVKSHRLSGAYFFTCKSHTHPFRFRRAASTCQPNRSSSSATIASSATGRSRATFRRRFTTTLAAATTTWDSNHRLTHLGESRPDPTPIKHVFLFSLAAQLRLRFSFM